MSVSKSVRRAGARQEQERGTWAETGVTYMTYDYTGTGGLVTEVLDFKTVFVSEPFFTFGVELQPDNYLVEGDYPFVSCGVSSWSITEVPADSTAEAYYLGAQVWINVSSSTVYALRFRLAFEGILFKNVENFRG